MQEVDSRKDVGLFNNSNASQGNMSRYDLDDLNDTMLSSAQRCWSYYETCWCNTVYILTAIGLVGNFLTFLVVLRRPSLRQKSTFVYILFLAGADQLKLSCLSCQCIFWSLGTEPPCEANLVIAVVHNASYLLSLLYVFALTVERLIIIFKPLQASSLCTRRRALQTCSGLAVFTLVLVSASKTAFCSAHFNTMEHRAIFLPYIYYVAWFVITLAIITMTVAIVCNLRKSHSVRRQLAGHQQHGDSSGTTDTKVNILLLTTLTAFILLTLPFIIFNVFMRAENMLDIGGGISTERTYQNMYMFVGSTLFLISLLNHNTNFFLYVASGHIFRDELVNLFKECICCRRWNAETSTRRAENDAQCLGSRNEPASPITASTTSTASWM